VPKIETVTVRIATGKSGTPDPVRIRFNNFEIPLRVVSGGVGPHETFEGTFRLGSVGHSCSLLGPKAGAWDIEQLEVTWTFGPVAEPSTHRFGRVSLAAGQDVNILDAPPPPPFEV
jgi:hypothetical protein